MEKTPKPRPKEIIADEVAGEIKAVWQNAVEKMEETLANGGRFRTIKRYHNFWRPLTEKHSKILREQVDVLKAKLDGRQFPGKAARKHLHRSLEGLVDHKMTRFEVGQVFNVRPGVRI